MNRTFFNPKTKELVTETVLQFQGMDTSNPEILQNAGLFPVTYDYPAINSNVDTFEPEGLPVEVDGVYKQQFKVVQLPDDVLEQNLLNLQKSKLEQVRADADKAAEPFLADFSTPEKLTFDMQMQEVYNYQKNSEAPTPILDALAQGRGISREELIEKAIVRAEQFMSLVSGVVGKQQGYEDEINSIARQRKTTRDKILELDSLTFDFNIS